MSKKLEKNGLWESSRMMLPQHKEAALERVRISNYKARKELDEQVQSLISEALYNSMHTKKDVTICMFDVKEDLQIVGVVERLDQQTRRFRVDGEWFKLEDIVSAELED